MQESLRQAKEEAEKALDISDLSQSDKDKSVRRQRFVTQRYSPPMNKILGNCRKNNIPTDDSDSDFEFNAPVVKNLKISGS